MTSVQSIDIDEFTKAYNDFTSSKPFFDFVRGAAGTTGSFGQKGSKDLILLGDGFTERIFGSDFVRKTHQYNLAESIDSTCNVSVSWWQCFGDPCGSVISKLGNCRQLCQWSRESEANCRRLKDDARSFWDSKESETLAKAKTVLGDK